MDNQSGTVTQVKTQSITKLKLALATLALAVAGNVALAAAPVRSTSTTYLTVNYCRAVTGGISTTRQYLNSCTAGKAYTYTCINDNTYRLTWAAPCDGAVASHSFTDIYVNGSCRQLDNGVELTENFNNGCSGSSNYTYSCYNSTRMRKIAGTCVSGCSDSDGGRNLITRGMAVLFSGSKATTSTSDSCVNANTVAESVCGSGRATKVNLPCPSGFNCSAGSCRYVGPSTTCSDSDGGNNSAVVGTVSETDLTTGRVTSVTDDCLGHLYGIKDNKTVLEYICGVDNRLALTSSTCSVDTVCYQGACANRFCEDTDGGNDIYHFGTAEVWQVSDGAPGFVDGGPDSCANTTTVREAYCVGNDANTVDVPCPSGLICSAGACVSHPPVGSINIRTQSGLRDYVVVSGSNQVLAASYIVSATGEDFTLSGAKLTLGNPAYVNDITRAHLVFSSNISPVTSTRDCFLDASGTCTFADGTLDELIPKDGYLYVTVLVDLNTIDFGAHSGDSIKFGLAKTSNQFGSTANLTDEFVVRGRTSAEKLRGNIDNISLDDSVLPSVVIHKTNIYVYQSDPLPSTHSVRVHDTLGVFTFTSLPENGSGQDSTLNDVTVQLTGSLIANAAGDDSVTLYAYDGSVFDPSHLMGTGSLIGLDNGSSDQVTLHLTNLNQWSGTKKLYLVADTTDSDFLNTPTITENLSLGLKNYTWSDGVVAGINPFVGLPVYSRNYIY